MPKKNSEKEIEEAHNKVRGELKKADQKPEQKKESEEKSGLEEKKNEPSGKEEVNTSEEEELQSLKSRKEADLEEITRNAGTGVQPLPGEVRGSEYVEQLSHKPMGEIYKEIKDIYKMVEDKGYLSPTEQKQIEYLSSAVQQKFEDEEQGIYSFSEEAARAASVTQQLSASMMGTYKGKKMNELYHR